LQVVHGGKKLQGTLTPKTPTLHSIQDLLYVR
jgi:hypothetical protein